jgi:putative drug exporter of the RND superfamily
MTAWTNWIIAHRKRVIAVWIVIVVAAGWAASGLGGLLTNRFSVPGSEAEQGRTLLGEHFQQRGDGDFTLIGRATGASASSPAFKDSLERAARRGAGTISGARAGLVQAASPRIAYVEITTPLENQDASDKTTAVRDAIGQVPGMTTYLSGAPAVNHDTQKIYNDDLAKG